MNYLTSVYLSVYLFSPLYLILTAIKNYFSKENKKDVKNKKAREEMDTAKNKLL